MRIALSLPAKDASPWMELFAQALPEATLDRHEPDRDADPRASRADYAVAAYPSRTFFVEQPSPRAVFTVSAGVGHVLAMPRLPDGAPVIRVEDAGMVSQMVRYAMTAAMRFTQRLDAYRGQQEARVWRQHPPRAPAQVEAGVMGLGVIGGAIARALAAQGFNVRGYATHPKSLTGVRCHAGEDALADFLAGLDVLVCVLPATPSTEGLLDRAAMSRLAAGAHVVNIGRGSLVVDDDLVALIDEGRLSRRDARRIPRRAAAAVAPVLEPAADHRHAARRGTHHPRRDRRADRGQDPALERGEPVTGVVHRTRGY